MNYPILLLTLVTLATIGSIGLHQLTIDRGIISATDITSVTNSEVGIEHPIPLVTDPNLPIELYCHRVPSVLEYPRLNDIIKM